MKSTIIIEPHYLPSLEFFCALKDFDQVLLEGNEHYVKQSYRSRTFINTTHGKEMLVVPVTEKGSRIAFRDVKIDYSKKWVNNHWRALESAYRKSPFYQFFSDELAQILYSKPLYLFELNIKLLSLCLKWLGWEKVLIQTTEYEPKIVSGLDMRNALNAKKSHMDRKVYFPVAYRQVFGSCFADNLSILDLIFCCGPEASLILTKSGLINRE